MSQEPSPRLRLACGLAKLAAIPLGLVGTGISLMAAVGSMTGSIYARLGAALVGTIIVPLAIADRLLPKDDPRRARGIVTDVFAVGLLGFAFVFTAAGNKATRPLLIAEGDRLVRAGWTNLARVAYVLASAQVTWPEIAPEAQTTAGAAGTGDKATAPVDAAAGTSTSSAGTAAVSDAGVTDAGVTDAAAVDAANAADAADAAVPADAGAVPVERTPAELFQKLSPAVVTIFVLGAEGQRTGSGTGFFIDREGTLVTNHHVIKEARRLRLKLKSGATYEQVDLLSDIAESDLALLRVDLAKPSNDAGAPEAPEPLPLGDSEKVVVGEHAVSIGNPLGLEHTLTDGLISSRRVYEGRPWIQMSVPISPGNSGGPVFNMRGEVIGISTATLSGPFSPAQNLNLAIPVNELKRHILPTYPQRRRFGDEGASPTQW
ncbi:S1C family serine protease [Chondromyces apiculatus]|uniref:HtrA protease/chaperone protein n=1 Tax=Chondromyces apiculatus DSM 436 TaxID=1192034 RepID=A0A017TC82_9BACT|nr:trypsin-like peptidase domain-containing protein [Chondromyces apiculatus]EYF06859.1 HtrA protease/chaperone protein [Chondromyces apiculatus DSM 436]